MSKKVYLCTKCGKRPQAPNGWFLCWECEALWDAECTIAAAQRMLTEGQRKLENAHEMLRKAEQVQP
jgi:hypothetical protein